MSICHACGTRHIPGERFCRKCGEKSRAFALTWTIGGAFLMLALAALIIMLLTAAGVLERPTPPLSALDQAGSAWVGGALALGFLLGGLAIGRVLGGAHRPGGGAGRGHRAGPADLVRAAQVLD